MPAAKVTPPPDEKPDSKAKPDPPPKDTTKPKAGGRPSGRPPALETKLRELFTQIAGAVFLVNKRDGEIIRDAAPDLAKAWNQLASENAAVKSFLVKLTTGGAIGGVVLSSGSLVFAILANHGVFEGLSLPGMGAVQEGAVPVPPVPPPGPTRPPRPGGDGPSPHGPAAVSL